MCVLAVTKPKAIISDAIMNECHSWNRDGMGFAFIREKKVVIDKGYTDLAAFKRKYKELIDAGVNENPMLVHFRACTAGPKTQDNCHPFFIKGGAMAHNGTFFGRGQDMGGKSDSRIVAERMFNNLEYSLVKRNFEGFQRALGYSRVAFLYDNGEVIISNEKQGEWHDGVWYSNAGFRPRVTSANSGGLDSEVKEWFRGRYGSCDY